MWRESQEEEAPGKNHLELCWGARPQLCRAECSAVCGTPGRCLWGVVQVGEQRSREG